MRNRFAIAALFWPMIQAVLFGLGVFALLIAPLSASQMMPAIWLMVAATAVIAIPLAWVLAPRLRLRGRRG